ACRLAGGYISSSTGQVSAWAPQDYGQARMAALGWQLSLAGRQGTGKGDALIAAFRKAAEKGPADVPALWDWVYLCQMRYDNAGAYAAARELTRATPTDPLALWAYLYSLGGRQLGLGFRYYSYSGRDRHDSTPSLDKDEVDHVLACYRALRTRRP